MTESPPGAQPDPDPVAGDPRPSSPPEPAEDLESAEDLELAEELKLDEDLKPIDTPEPGGGAESGGGSQVGGRAKPGGGPQPGGGSESRGGRPSAAEQWEAASQRREAEQNLRLLVQAVGLLPEPDREHLYVWLLNMAARVDVPPGSVIPGAPAAAARRLKWATQAARTTPARSSPSEVFESLQLAGFRGSSGAAQQMVPVRFSAEQHARLRAWCSEHGFSMATVIRGLVDRFLDSQQAGQP